MNGHVQVNHVRPDGLGHRIPRARNKVAVHAQLGVAGATALVLGKEGDERVALEASGAWEFHVGLGLVCCDHLSGRATAVVRGSGEVLLDKHLIVLRQRRVQGHKTHDRDALPLQLDARAVANEKHLGLALHSAPAEGVALAREHLQVGLDGQRVLGLLGPPWHLARGVGVLHHHERPLGRLVHDEDGIRAPTGRNVKVAIAPLGRLVVVAVAIRATKLKYRSPARHKGLTLFHEGAGGSADVPVSVLPVGESAHSRGVFGIADRHLVSEIIA
mmetsp:Transcript_14322/g.43537  ORF Transcript_14322/g.43537 Transcript_14322/m.43537 type:complete len:273 (+) Transcript_14322:786-1604(+)